MDIEKDRKKKSFTGKANLEEENKGNKKGDVKGVKKPANQKARGGEIKQQTGTKGR